MMTGDRPALGAPDCDPPDTPLTAGADPSISDELRELFIAAVVAALVAEVRGSQGESQPAEVNL